MASPSPHATRPIGLCILVNPPGWRFWARRILARHQLRAIPGLPKARRLGVNPALMDCGGSKLFAPADTARSRAQKLRDALLGRRRERFAARCDALVATPAGCKLAFDRETLGVLGCALSHVEAWRVAAELPDDALCLIVEDDLVAPGGFDAKRVPWPEDADFVHLFPGGIVRAFDHSQDLVRPDPDSDENWGTVAYAVSGASARRLLAALAPLPLVETPADARPVPIDSAMLRNPRIHAYALRDGGFQHLPAISSFQTNYPAGILFKKLALFALFYVCCYLPQSWRRPLTARFRSLREAFPHDNSPSP